MAIFMIERIPGPATGMRGGKGQNVPLMLLVRRESMRTRFHNMTLMFTVGL